jgi:hypothetical protein
MTLAMVQHQMAPPPEKPVTLAEAGGNVTPRSGDTPNNR